MVQGLKMALAPVTWRFIEKTVRVKPLTRCLLDSPQPVILSCLHRDILPAIIHVKPAKPALLVSTSPDGDILVRTLGTRHYRFVRGGTGDDGKRAFMDLVRHLEAGHNVGLAVDGPKGPYGVIADGVMQLARLTGAPVIPLIAEANKAKVLNTWDRTIVPWPGSQVSFRHGEPLFVERHATAADLAHAKGILARFFDVEREQT